ncbi:hypothetical protein MTO96_035581, partial [Rhipicephalus appendiculatus]
MSATEQSIFKSDLSATDVQSSLD